MKTKNIEKLGKAMLMALLLCIPFSFLSSCSDDDGDEKLSEFEKILTRGAWAQNGDDDIFIFNSDGTWYTYNCPEEFENKDEKAWGGTWLYNNNILTIRELYYYDGDEKVPLSSEDAANWTEMFSVTTYSSDFFSCTQTYPEEDKGRVWNFTQYK